MSGLAERMGDSQPEPIRYASFEEWLEAMQPAADALGVPVLSFPVPKYLQK